MVVVQVVVAYLRVGSRYRQQQQQARESAKQCNALHSAQTFSEAVGGKDTGTRSCDNRDEQRTCAMFIRNDGYPTFVIKERGMQLVINMCSAPHCCRRLFRLDNLTLSRSRQLPEGAVHVRGTSRTCEASHRSVLRPLHKALLSSALSAR